MLGGQLRQPVGLAARQRPVYSVPAVQRRSLTIQAAGNFFDKFKGQKGDKSGGSGDAGKGVSKEEAARKALQDSFNSKKYENFFGKQNSGGDKGQQQGGGSGGPGGFGGGGGGGFGGQPLGGGGDANRSMGSEILSMLWYTLMVAGNLVVFLGFVFMMHSSLDWCCQVELLLLVGAPQQAMERVLSVFFDWVEWAERNLLGWDVPGAEGKIPMYQNIKMFYPEAHAYTFDQYRYKLSTPEAQTLKKMYALRHYERQGGRRGDVSQAEVDAILARHDPGAADRAAWKRAVREGRTEEYWQGKGKQRYEEVVGQRFERPPGAAAPTRA